MKVQKIIELIKRSYDQPILFHRLHCHLAYILEKGNLLYEISDEWSRILVLSATQSKDPNQGLERKILSFLKEIRPSVSSKESRLKLWIILYYLSSRSPTQVNHLVLFELVSNFIGTSPFVDGLILSIFSRAVTCTSFGLESNKKLGNESIGHLLEIIKKKSLGVLCRALALPCYINHKVEPPSLLDLVVENDAQTLIVLERVFFYAKYSKHVEFVKKIVPDDAVFVSSLKEFISKSFRVSTKDGGGCQVADSVVDNLGILNEIKRAYEEARDKKRFVSRITEFVMELDK
ncbi:putative suppressor of tubulin [Encephalitozoon intestinalis]